jgi:hypothetical protein
MGWEGFGKMRNFEWNAMAMGHYGGRREYGRKQNPVYAFILFFSMHQNLEDYFFKFNIQSNLLKYYP